MRLTKENMELIEKVRKDLESKGVTVNTMEARVIGNDVDYTIIAEMHDGTIWEICEIEDMEVKK